MRFMIGVMLGLALLTTSALAGETYSGGFSPSLSGGSRHVQLTLEIEKREEATFTGVLIISGLRHAVCGTHRKVTGQSTPGGQFQFKTAEGEAEGCGVIQFGGRQEGEAVSGNIRFLGQSHDMTFSKK